MNNDDFTVLVSGGGRHHWVSMCMVWPSHSKGLSKQSNESALNFVLSLNIPPQKLYRWLRRLQQWATGDWQLHHSTAPFHASPLRQYFGKTSNHPGDSAHLQPRFGTLQLVAFPQTKITFEREETSDHWWDSGKYNGATDGHWENCVRSQGAYLEGDWVINVLCILFLVSSSISASIFHIIWLDTF